MAGPSIQPRTLPGFRDYPPELAIPRERLMDTARAVYRLYGYSPIDTPALEYAEVLLGKLDPEAEIQRQIYRFEDAGGRDVALRFDLTVPFARFAAQHIGRLGTPFKRYHVGPVWRGERPQAGRYREFVQCDFDTIGTTSNAADIETALVIHDLMEALGFSAFKVRVSNRLVLSGLLASWGVGDRAPGVLRAVDKLAKQGRAAVEAELVDVIELSVSDAGRLLDLVSGPSDGDGSAVLDLAVAEAKADGGEGHDRAVEGVARLRQLLGAAAESGVPKGRIVVDLAISRGLDYYTGTVYETFLDAAPQLGSVCSGGRYDDLAGLYTKQSLPGVGASLGVDRLLAAMEELGMIEGVITPAPVFVVQFTSDGLGRYQALARSLRREGIGAEVYPDARKVGQQLAYAERRGFRVAVVAGPAELDAGTCNVKDLASRRERTVGQGDLVREVRRILEDVEGPQQREGLR